jgi:uncharacterized surface protein with fasciclin (FAS1) repeats
MHILQSKLEHQELVNIYDRGRRKIAQTSINGTQLDIDLSDGIKIGNARILSVDNSVDNGIIYPIDRVLFPNLYD